MLNAQGLRRLFVQWANIMAAHEQELIELDGLCGDSDLGLTMAKGFGAAVKAAGDSTDADLGKLAYIAGKAMGQAVPSTMGTLMAAGLMSAGKALRGKETLAEGEQALFFRAFYEGVANLGGAKEGEKTFLDGLGPALLVLEAHGGLEDSISWANRVNQALLASKKGYENTCGMLAKHGRMAIRGEESRRYYDPGARVALLLMQGYQEFWQKELGHEHNR